MTQPTARRALYDALMTDGIPGRGHSPDRSEQATTLIEAFRDEVLIEAAELIREHHGDLSSDVPWWDTRDRDAAAALLLAARTAPDATSPRADARHRLYSDLD